MKKLLLIFITGLVFIALGFWGWNEGNTWGYRKALPRSAEEINELALQPGFIPDYSYFLKAKIKEKEFLKYVEKYDLKPFPENTERPEEYKFWFGTEDIEKSWWTPSPHSVGSYIKRDDSMFMCAKYENGYIYFKAIRS